MGRKRSGRRKARKKDDTQPHWKKTLFFIAILGIVIASAVVLYISVRAADEGGLVDDGNGPNTQDDDIPSDIPAFDFTVTDVDGNIFKLSAQTERLVIVDLMATWCRPCTAQVPNLEDAVAILGAANLQVISIDVDLKEGDAELRQYRDEHNITWPVSRDTAGLSDRYGVSSIPTLLLYDQDGHLLKKWVGTTDSGDIISECKKHM